MTDALTIDHANTPALIEPPMIRADVPVLIDPATAFLPAPWEMIERGAMLIASCPGVSPHLRTQENAMFVSYQAARWRMDPIMVALKTYFTERKGGPNAGLLVGYEAQLVHALVESDPDLVEPLDFQFGYSDPKKTLAQFRFCKVIGILRTARKPRNLTTPTVGQIKIKNSPLWFSDPDQQLSYYGARAWARRYRPGRLLGVYTRDEIDTFKDADGVHKMLPPMFEEDDAPVFDGIEPTADDAQVSRGVTTAARGPAPPPDGSDNRPEGLDDDKVWAAAERDRIVALGDRKTIANAADIMVADKRFKRLLAYEQAFAHSVDRVFKGRLAEFDK